MNDRFIDSCHETAKWLKQDRSAHMTEDEIKKRLVAHGVASLDGTYVHASMDEVLKALAVTAPDAGLVEREAIALLVWHRFANSNVQTFEDETHKAEYLDCADAILALLSTRAVAGEPVAWRYRYANCEDDWTAWRLSKKQPALVGNDMQVEALYAHPAPSGRDPATIELQRLREVADATQSLLSADEFVHPTLSRDEAVSQANQRLRQTLGTWQMHHTACLAAPAVVTEER